jgi:hypothetical protein
VAAFTFSARWSPGPSHTTLVDATIATGVGGGRSLLRTHPETLSNCSSLATGAPVKSGS